MKINKQTVYECEVCPIAGCIGECDCELEIAVTAVEQQWSVPVRSEIRE